jgi:hypothetical protein
MDVFTELPVRLDVVQVSHQEHPEKDFRINGRSSNSRCQIEHRQLLLSILGQEFGQLLGLRQSVIGVRRNDLVAFGHRWRLLFWRKQSPGA